MPSNPYRCSGCGAAINASYGLCIRCQRAGRGRARAAVVAGLLAVGVPGLISTGYAAAHPGPAVGEHVSVAGYSVPGEAVPCPVIVADRPSDELATILGPGETVRIVPITDLRPAELGGGCSW